MKLNTTLQAALLMTLASIFALSSGCGAQDASSCVRQLLPCLSFLNGTRDPPADSCCNPLKLVVNDNPECLCKLISIKGARQAQRAGINTDEAQELPGRCGQRVNPIACLMGSTSSSGNSGERSSAAAAMAPSSSTLGFLAFLAILCLLGTIQNHLV